MTGEKLSCTVTLGGCLDRHLSQGRGGMERNWLVWSLGRLV